jgi:hypothetical protein
MDVISGVLRQPSPALRALKPNCAAAAASLVRFQRGSAEIQFTRTGAARRGGQHIPRAIGRRNPLNLISDESRRPCHCCVSSGERRSGRLRREPFMPDAHGAASISLNTARIDATVLTPLHSDAWGAACRRSFVREKSGVGRPFRISSAAVAVGLTFQIGVTLLRAQSASPKAVTPANTIPETDHTSSTGTVDPKVSSAIGSDNEYPWLITVAPSDSIEHRIAPPEGLARVTEKKGSFAAWLRGLPLKPGTPPVHLHNGRLKDNQSAHAAVFNMDVGTADLQQCADAVIRLRAEYLWNAGRSEQIAFHFSNGDLAEYRRWSEGVRPLIRGSRVSWSKTAKPDRTYTGFRKYLDTVFTYAGIASLERELAAVAADEPIHAGDIFIKGGSPGHAVIVVDLAQRPEGNENVFLLAQSYMPAQEIQILKNPNNQQLTPWYTSNSGEELVTPEWTFSKSSRRRFRE